MDEEDFRALIAILETQFRDIGAAELADENHYVRRDSETGEERLQAPQERLIAMLRAFDRYLAVRDGATFQDAMRRLRRSASGDGPERVIFVPISDEITREECDLSNAPNLSEVRAALRAIIEQIGAEPGAPPPTEAF